jgi:hypothetical protein
VTLVTSSGSVENLNVSARQGLHPVLPPRPRHRGVPEFELASQQPARRVRHTQVRTRRFERRRHDRPVIDRPRPTRMRLISQAFQTALLMTGPPRDHGLAGHPHPPRDFGVRHALRPSSTIRARATSPAGADDDRISARSRAPSPARNASGAATAMPHSPKPAPPNNFRRAALEPSRSLRIDTEGSHVRSSLGAPSGYRRACAARVPLTADSSSRRFGRSGAARRSSMAALDTGTSVIRLAAASCRTPRYRTGTIDSAPNSLSCPTRHPREYARSPHPK